MNGKNLFLALMCVNLVLYFSGFALTEDDLLGRFMDKEEIDEGNFNINEDVQDRIPEETSSGIISGAVNFLDVVALFWDFIKLMFNIVSAPVALFTIGMHPTISVFIGVPYVLMLLLTIMQFSRGANL